MTSSPPVEALPEGLRRQAQSQDATAPRMDDREALDMQAALRASELEQELDAERAREAAGSARAAEEQARWEGDDHELDGFEPSETEEVYLHGSNRGSCGDALFRALAPVRCAGKLVRCDSSSSTVTQMLAESQAALEGKVRKRQSFLLSDKETLAREYLVARRLSEQSRGWASEWALQNHSHRFRGRVEMQRFLKSVRRWASIHGTAKASSHGLRRVGGALGMGACKPVLSASKRRRLHGAGGPGKMKCPEIADELFAWFVDSIKNIKGRIPSSLLLLVARSLASDLQQWHQEEKEHGRIVPHAKLELPVLDHCWLRRWRRVHHLSWRSVNLRFKCKRAVLKKRLFVFWSNVLRVRFLHSVLEAEGELVFEGMDQKPLWFTASSQEKTLGFQGARKVAVKENVPMTRARFTAMTRCRWPSPPEDEKNLAVLFKAKGGGGRIREGLRVPPGVLLQFAEKGSYRLANVLEYFEWVMDRSRLAVGPYMLKRTEEGLPERFVQVERDASGSVVIARDAGLEPRTPGRRVVYLLDWFAPRLDRAVDDLIHSAGHVVLRIGGHLTSLVQVEDTHAHGPYTAKYKQCETDDAWQQLLVRPDKLPSTSRQTVLDRANQAWSFVNHTKCSLGFVENGITNALDGHEDALLTADVVDFWHELDMPAVRERIKKEVDDAVASSQVLRFEDYWKLLESYDDHAGMVEGQEAFGVQVCDDGAADVDSGSATDEELAVGDLGVDNEDGVQLVSAPAERPIPESLPAVVPEEHALVLVMDPKKKEAANALAGQVSRQRDATLAALQAAQAVGGDAQLVETLQQRLRALSKQSSAVSGPARVHVHAKQLERQAEVKRQRLASLAQETEEKNSP